MKAIVKSVVLLLLIIILSAGGLLWFDYLGVLEAQKLLTPVYKILKVKMPTSKTATTSSPVTGNLDEDRLNKQRESLTLYKEELEKREKDLQEREAMSEQISRELLEKEKTQEKREESFSNTLKLYEDKNINVSRIVANLNGMKPEAAVNILLSMDDQTVIDVLRKTEEVAKQNGVMSMGSYWLSLMPSERAATIQRKMLVKPDELE